MNRSTISSDVKDALAREQPLRECCRGTLLRSLAHYGGHAGAFRTQRPAVARLFHALQPRDRATPIATVAGKRLYRATQYIARIPDGLGPDQSPRAVAAAQTKARLERQRRCCRRIELRAAFLACGSLSLPGKGYHLEFTAPNQTAATRIARLLRAERLAPHTATRRGKHVVYLKEVEAIVAVLGAIGAHAAVLRVEDVRAMKETKNRIHRLVNVEAANVARAVHAAARQRHAIETIKERYGLSNLTPPLREAAELRLKHPELTLGELAALTSPPTSRPTLNGRLQALIRMAHRLTHAHEQAPSKGTR